MGWSLVPPVLLLSVRPPLSAIPLPMRPINFDAKLRSP